VPGRHAGLSDVDARLDRTLRNDLGELAAVARDVRAWLQQAGVAEPLSHAVDLALEELVGNTIRYGYDDGDVHRIRVQLELTADELRLTLEDDGRPFDPTRAPEPPRPRSLSEAPPGGRGIPMVRRLFHDMRYQRAPGANRLALSLPRRG